MIAISRLYILSLCGLLLYSACGADRFAQGEAIYEQACANCHMSDGGGVGNMYPAIRQSAYLTTRISELPCLIRHGKQSDILDNVIMPSNKNMTPTSIVNLVNYLNHRWGNATFVTPQEVEAQLSDCP